jgi:hypothetical protein
MGSLASPNHQAITGAKPASQISPFPPAPKSVRVLSVFSHDQPERAPERLGGPHAQVSRSVPRWLWALAFAVILGLILAAILGARLGNYLPI